MRKMLVVASLAWATAVLADSGAWRPATEAINALGCELLAGTSGNALLSPYSIQTALGMTYAGAAGETRTEMARVLHFGADEEALHRSFASLQKAFAEADDGDAVILGVANRLFGQKDYAFRPEFLALVEDVYGAPLQLADFVGQAQKERSVIKAWVEEQTRDRIRDLLPENTLNALTRLVLVNAVYMKARWEQAFPAHLTKPAPFRTAADTTVDVPTLNRTGVIGYRKDDGFTAVSLPYLGGNLQFLVLLPDETVTVAAVEAKLTADRLAGLAMLPRREVNLYLPKFRMEPPLLKLSDALKGLGMRTAFDEPAGSADFDRMAPRRPDDYLCISEVFHKTFMELDEKGTEAAAATAVVMQRATAMRPTEPVVVRVDRPFLFAVQHRASGACLFLGRLVDPR